MPRLARTVCTRVPHHITQRGNRREDVFFTDEDREIYLAWRKDYADQHAVDILAYYQMALNIPRDDDIKKYSPFAKVGVTPARD